jgi:hypothetical protein
MKKMPEVYLVVIAMFAMIFSGNFQVSTSGMNERIT